MADYWKSQPRKFCQYCKCWIADNKPSVEFHERGKNHKENVAAKISEIKKKSVDKAKQEERMSKEFAAMEEAAMKAYQEDLKRLEREASGSVSPVRATAQPQPQVRPQVRPQVKPQVRPKAKKQQRKAKPSQKSGERPEVAVWVEGQSDDGHVYYYNTVTGESQWDKPEGFQGGSSASAQPESSSGRAWVEAVSPDGYTYYYNSETGESSWEKPADFTPKEDSGSSGEGQDREEARPESPAAGEGSSGWAPAPQEAEVPAESKPKVPKISFRKRKAEAEPSEKEGDKVSDDAPKEDAKEAKKEEEVQVTTAEPEEEKKKEEEEEVTRRKTPAKRPRAANPYGAWEQIQEEKDPYASVDLQLPQAEEIAAGAPPEEPKPKFKERVVTSLGGEGGPAAFRRNRTQNGKSRSLRQRDGDDD